MKKIFGFLVVLTLVFSSFVAKAQNDGVVFTLLPQIPYSNYFNPGIRVPYNGVIGFGISNIGVSVYNSSLKYGNIYTTVNGEDVIDGFKLVNSLREQDNFLNVNMSIDILNAGIRFKKFFFSLDWRMRVSGEIQYSKDFLGFFILGNGHYLGEENPCDFNVGADVTMFSELGVGVQYDVNDKLTVGVRPKYLSGIVNVTVDNEHTKIITDPQSYAVSADVNLNIKAASIFNAKLATIKDIDKLFDNSEGGTASAKNTGFGIDFGASYKINNHWGVAAGVYDLGYIKWKESRVRHTNKENVEIGNSLFDGLEDIQNLNFDYKGMLDRLVDEVWGNDSLYDGGSYKTTLKTRIMAQGYYELNPMLRISAIGQFYSTKGSLKQAYTLAYSGMFCNHWNAALSYTISSYTGNALGIGFGMHFGPFNFYAVSDNILGLFKVGAPIEEYATAYQTAGARLGVVWTLGKYQGSKNVSKKKTDEMEMEVDKKVDTEAIDKEKEEFEKKISDDTKE